MTCICSCPEAASLQHPLSPAAASIFFPCVLGAVRDSRRDLLLLCGHVGEEKQTARCKREGFFPCLGVSCPGDAASRGETACVAEPQGEGRCCGWGESLHLSPLLVMKIWDLSCPPA